MPAQPRSPATRWGCALWRDRPIRGHERGERGGTGGRDARAGGGGCGRAGRPAEPPGRPPAELNRGRFGAEPRWRWDYVPQLSEPQRPRFARFPEPPHRVRAPQ